MIKFCKNCVHFSNGYFIGHSICRRSKVLNYVTGKEDVIIEYAYIERKNDNLCGKDAKYFEQKPKTLFEKLFRRKP